MSIRQLIIVCVLLTFVGQAFASVILPCPMEMKTVHTADGTKTSQASQQKNTCHHSTITNKDMGKDVTDKSHSDCCDSQCSCPMGSCLSVALTMKQLELEGNIQATEFTQILVVSVLPQYKSSLYRPPIYA
ncbi:CopL family metal-binding regulatory protein [Shewanella sp.]|uniref:CopL family metal-binding regulatory protein n=1 Tax=Shewanella sp. TaxID=50422 RepID=UPI003A8C2661